jgi:anti-anti-sigma factor
MEIQSEFNRETLIIALAGSFDALTAGEAQSDIGAQLEAGQGRVVLDLGQVDFMSSSGVRVLLETLRKSRSLGGDLRLAGAQLGVQRTLEISGLVRVLGVYPSVEEAVRSFGSGSAGMEDSMAQASVSYPTN